MFFFYECVENISDSTFCAVPVFDLVSQIGQQNVVHIVNSPQVLCNRLKSVQNNLQKKKKI